MDFGDRSAMFWSDCREDCAEMEKRDDEERGRRALFHAMTQYRGASDPYTLSKYQWNVGQLFPVHDYPRQPGIMDALGLRLW